MNPAPTRLPTQTERAVSDDLASVRHRLDEWKNLKHEELLELLWRKECAREHDKPADRITLLKVGVAFMATKNKLPMPFGGELDTDVEAS